MAVRKALSPMALRALMPARSNSLFLTGRLRLAARCLSASSTAYSDFGMVKLSRTSLCLTLAGGAGTAAGCAAAFLATDFLALAGAGLGAAAGMVFAAVRGFLGVVVF